MSLLGRTKTFFDPNVHLRCPGSEPAAAASGQRFRLGNFAHAEHIAIETAGPVFTTARHGNLHVVNTQNFRHFVSRATADMASARNLRRISSAPPSPQDA